MTCRLAGVSLALVIVTAPLSAQDDAADHRVNPRPDISWWDSDYWAEWEADRQKWRSDWLDYELRHPGRVSNELSRVIRGGTPTPHRIDGGAAALAELDYGFEPGTLTRELRWMAYDRDLSRGRAMWAHRDGTVDERVFRDRLDAEVRRATSRRDTRERLDRVRDWYRSVFGSADRAERLDRTDRLRDNERRRRGDRGDDGRTGQDRRRSRRGGS